jgi:hypothetical protein
LEGKVKPALLHFTAEALVKDISAILTALLHGRDSCEGRIHFKVEPRKPAQFTIVVGDPKDPIHD